MALPSLKKTIWSAVGVVAASTALMGFAHTAPGRPLLALMGGKSPADGATGRGGSACPLGFSKIDPSQKDAVLQQQASQLRGTQPAAAKPALAFSLEKTTKADVQEWGRTNQLACRDSRFMSDFECSDVQAQLLSHEAAAGPLAKVVKFTFDSQDRLVGVTAIRYDRDPGTLAAFYKGTVTTLAEKAGSASKQHGEATAENLLEGRYNRLNSTFAFTNYHAKASVSQVREGEFMFVEEYRSLPN